MEKGKTWANMATELYFYMCISGNQPNPDTYKTAPGKIPPFVPSLPNIARGVAHGLWQGFDAAQFMT